MARNLTTQQSMAVLERAVSVGLSAGAGSGKTHVLTERFLSYLDPAGPDAGNLAQLDELTAITFTDAAAREMRDRVRAACYQRLETAPPTEESHWYALLRSLDSARISTIHAYCSTLLRHHAVEAGIDPRFTVLDENQAAVIRTQLVDDLLREKLAARDEPTMHLAHAWGIGKLRSRILELVASIHDDAFRSWADRPVDDLLDAWESNWHAPPFRNALLCRIVDSPESGEVRRILLEVTIDHPVFTERRALILDQLTRGRASAPPPAIPAISRPGPGSLPTRAASDPFADLRALRAAAQVRGAGGASLWPDPDQYGRYQEACKKLRDVIDRTLADPFDRAVARPWAQAALALHQLAIQAADRYAAEKERQARLDFDDLVAKTVHLLAEPKHASVRDRLVRGSRAILVDEFQDTDAHQAHLIKMLSGDAWNAGRLFFVGDLKQSIYRFRGAQPSVFSALRSDLPDRGSLSLTHCFRTQPALLDFINALFVGFWGSGYERLEPVRSQISPEPAVEFLWTIAHPDPQHPHDTGSEPGHAVREPSGDSGGLPAHDGSRPKPSTTELRMAEARTIAAHLVGLLNDPTPRIPDRKQTHPEGTPTLRPLQPGDIVILFRALTDVQVYEKALQEAGLDYYLVGGHAFYAQQEVYDLANLLGAVASPADEIALAGALRSPFFGLADETLFWLVRHGGSLHAGLFDDESPAMLPESERLKVRRAAGILGWLRAIQDHEPIAGVIQKALAATGYDATLLADFLGERKLANLRKLQRHARAADRDGLLGLHGFISQLMEFIVRMPKEPPASTSAMEADILRLMTVHQAKGLEFPCVVVADLDRPTQDGRGQVAYTPELGPMVRPAPEEPLSFAAGEPTHRQKSATGFDIYQAIERQGDQEESARLFYVACTRAADHLILSSGLNSFDRPRGKWLQLLARQYTLDQGRPIADLPPGYPEPRVGVVQRPLEAGIRSAGQRPRTHLRQAIAAAHAAAGSAPPPPSAVAPIHPDRSCRRRFSFSRLSGALVRLDEESEWAIHSGSASTIGPAVDPRQLGSLVHAMLENIDFRQPIDVPAVAIRIAPRFFVEETTPGPDHPAIGAAVAMVELFLRTPRAASFTTARRIHREVEFQLAWPPRHRGRPSPETALPAPGAQPGARSRGSGPWPGRSTGQRSVAVERGMPERYLHGTLDCLYETATGDWVLIDYKTNQIHPDRVLESGRPYEMQLAIYMLAVESALGRRPDEIVLHFLRTGQEHIFSWDAASEEAILERVRRAMALLMSSGDG